MAIDSPPAPTSALPVVPHRLIDDVLGMLVGALLISLGLTILSSGGAVTGGTAGLALLVSQALSLPTGLIFFVVNVPFFLLAIRGKGVSFTIRTGIAIVLVSVLISAQALFIDLGDLDVAYAALMGNVLCGVGLLILFRHRSSVGGFTIIALFLQDRFGVRAGYVLMALDTLVVAAALTVTSPLAVAISAAGVVVLNLILAVNHRPGRYVGA